MVEASIVVKSRADSRGAGGGERRHQLPERILTLAPSARSTAYARSKLTRLYRPGRSIAVAIITTAVRRIWPSAERVNGSRMISTPPPQMCCAWPTASASRGRRRPAECGSCRPRR